MKRPMNVSAAPRGRYYLKCRCGGNHEIPVEAKPCAICRTPTFDFHRVCPVPACRRAAALEAHADEILAVVADVDGVDA